MEEFQTNEEVIAHYADIVAHPGKFEGEAPWVPYFYEQMLLGEGTLLDDDSCELDIIEQDRDLWPELSGFASIILTETNEGFVVGKLKE